MTQTVPGTRIWGGKPLDDMLVRDLKAALDHLDIYYPSSYVKRDLRELLEDWFDKEDEAGRLEKFAAVDVPAGPVDEPDFEAVLLVQDLARGIDDPSVHVADYAMEKPSLATTPQMQCGMGEPPNRTPPSGGRWSTMPLSQAPAWVRKVLS